MVKASLMRIRLELARTTDFPDGSTRHGYELVAPLSEAGHVDAEAWRQMKDQCRVTRFWGDEDDEHGYLRHLHGGWLFDYGKGDDGGERFFKLDRHVFVPGAYVSITEHDGVERPFRVVSVLPAITAG